MSSEPSQKQLMANALVALKKAQAKVKQLQQAKQQPIAIIGLSCHLPGDIKNLTDINDKLSAQMNAISKVPANRWDSSYYQDDNPQAAGKMISDQGGFISDGDKFDNQFFNISPLEAKYIDPQQRLLLTHVWHALENANIIPSEQYQQAVGTFIGISTLDYATIVTKNTTTKDINGYMTAGSMHSMAVGRIASYFGFTGPAIAIDTACSSSLIAVHQACENLRNNACNLALAGGVNAIYDPQISIAFSKGQMLAADGRCKTFDQSADGYVRGEGVGIVVLKRLNDAKQDKDNILAIIKGSATNHNGPSGGLTVPSGKAQQQVIEQAIKNAGITANEIDCIEAHGTGTALGDPIELRALNQVFANFYRQTERQTERQTGRQTDRQTPLFLSSIKTNIGHLEAAAGIAGLIKMVAQLQRKTIYKHLNFSQATNHFDWQNSPITIPTEKLAWPKSDTPATGGVSSYGINGSNAHVILAEAGANDALSDSACEQNSNDNQANQQVLTLSAKSEYSLKQLISQYLKFLSTDKNLNNICYTSNIARSHFDYRFAVSATDVNALQLALEQAQKQNFSRATNKPINLYLTGELNNIDTSYSEHPVYQKHYQLCIDQGWSPNFASQYASAKTLIAWGLKADAITGINQGEVIASCINNTITLSQGSNALKRPTNSTQIKKQDNTLTITGNANTDLTQAYFQGAKLNWQAIHSGKNNHKVQLPLYPFEQHEFWIERIENKLIEDEKPWITRAQQSSNQLIAEFNQGKHKLVWDSLLFSQSYKKMLLGFLHHFSAPFAENPHQLAPIYQAWFKQSKKMLDEIQDKSTLPTIDQCWQQWQDYYQQLLSKSELKVYGLLLDACLKQLDNILTGKVKATDVLFPNGSMELMEGLYKRTAQSDVFNGVLHQSAIAYIKAQIAKGNKLHIAEVGAGTGGTTAGLMPLLDPLSVNIEQYCYTDLSTSFLRHGEQSYGKKDLGSQERSFFQTQLLNIEQAPNQQDFRPQSYDIVIATNVLHATKDIKTTLAHVKSMLRPGGILLLNEVNELPLLTSHFSIALLEGWWRFEDEDLRMPGSPAIYPQTWQQLLREQGFDLVEFPAEAIHHLGQQIIVAQSNGKVAQQLLTMPKSQPTPQLTDELMDDILDDLISTQCAESSSDTNNLLSQLESYLSHLIGEALQMPPSTIDRQTPLDNYGIDSIVISQLFGQLQQTFSDITPNLFFDHNRIDTISNYLLEQYPKQVEHLLSKNKVNSTTTHKNAEQSYDKRAVTCIKPCSNPNSRLLVFHPFGFGYQSIEWLKRLDSQVEVWAVGCEDQAQWQQLVPHLATEIKLLFDKPIIAWGHSMGAIVAFETLSYIQRTFNLHTQHLVVSSSSLTLFERMKYGDPFYQLDENSPEQTVIDDLTKGHILPPKDLLRSIAPQGILNDLQLCKSYQRDKSQTLNANITLVQANNDIILPDGSVMLDWQQAVTGECRYQEIDGNHMFFTRPPKAFVQILKQQFERSHSNQINAGIYQLTDFVAGTNDLHLTPFGRNPSGVLIYDNNGNSTLHIWHPKRPTDCFGAPFDSERYLTYFAYGGKYQQNAGIVKHHIATCLVPNWDGKTLQRSIELHQGPKEGFNLLTGPVISDQQLQYGFEHHQKLSWQPLELPPLAKLTDYHGAWDLVSITGDERLLASDAYNGQCIISEQGIISVLINPKTRKQLQAQNLYLVSDEEVKEVLSQSIHLLFSINGLDAKKQISTLVSQSCQAIDPQGLIIERNGENLTLSWPLVDGGQLKTHWQLD